VRTQDAAKGVHAIHCGVCGGVCVVCVRCVCISALMRRSLFSSPIHLFVGS
jgi:hypothetical protein